LSAAAFREGLPRRKVRLSAPADEEAAMTSARVFRGLPDWLRRRALRQRVYLTAAISCGFALGLAYRAAFNPAAERSFATFLASGLHGAGLALTVWIVDAVLARNAHGRFARRRPLAYDVVFRALATTAALVVVSLALQAALYAGTQRLSWLHWQWFAWELPRIVVLAFGVSLVIGIVGEAGRLIGGPMLKSLLLGTYLRPTRRPLIVMFLDLAHSTGLAETLGEVRVHDLVTRFFFDIDEAIADSGGTVHAYVGDEVIVSWPASHDAARNRRAVECFFRIEDRMAAAAGGYEAEFGLAPGFRAAIHTGVVVVSECGDARRQLAYFGDTMNVTARLCDYCKTAQARLVVSGDYLRIAKLDESLVEGPPQPVALRGREAPVEAVVVRRSGAAARS
jgi:class 3 adenylate cyclase